MNLALILITAKTFFSQGELAVMEWGENRKDIIKRSEAQQKD